MVFVISVVSGVASSNTAVRILQPEGRNTADRILQPEGRNTAVRILQPEGRSVARIQHFGEREGFSATLVEHIIQDRKGYIWLATWDGLRRYDGYRFETFKAVPGDKSPLETNRFTYIEEDATGNIVCISNEKLYLFNIKSRQFEPCHGKRIKTASYQASRQVKELVRQVKDFQSPEVNILLADRQEGVWIYSHRGLERISVVPTVIQPQQTNGEREQVVSALFTDREGRLWTADKQGYVSIRDGGGIRWLTANGTLSASRMRFGYAAYDIYEDSQRQVWIGCKPGGLFRLTQEGSGYRVTHFTHQADDTYSLNSDGIYSIAEDAQHRIVLATYGGGLNIGEPQPDGTMRFIHCGNRLKQYPQAGLRSRCLWLKDDGTVLLGTNDGLYTFSLHEPYEKIHFFVNHRRPDQLQSISNNFVMEIRQMRNGDLYLATSGGGTERILSKQLLSDTIRFQHHSVREGISSDMNQTLAEDMDGNLWIVSAGSVCLLNTRTGIATNYWRLLIETGNAFSDLWSENNAAFTEAKPALLPDSSMVLGTTNGTLTLRRDQMTKSAFVPPIVFDCEKEVSLSSDERDFTIRFAALEYNKNEEIIYAYRMEGIDGEWRYTRQNELNYASLAPGTYILHIKSTNGDGVWTDNETTITLHRAASFHETPWAWMLYGGLAALLLIIVVSTIRYIRMLKRELKDVRLTSKEQIEVLGAQLKELLPITESVKEIHEESVEQLTADDRLFAERLKKFVEGNFNNADLSVQDMASEMNVSRTVLFVRMKRIFNSSPNNYLLNTRITYAKKLLSEPDARVSDVAYRCGFSDPKYFSRCFKKLTGSLPKDYA